MTREEIIIDIHNMCSRSLQEGIDIGYKQGLNDAWKCARKIFSEYIFDSRFDQIFNGALVTGFFEKYSAAEAIEKVEEYEAKQKRGNVDG